MLHWLPWRTGVEAQSESARLVIACVDPLDTDGVNDAPLARW